MKQKIYTKRTNLYYSNAMKQIKFKHIALAIAAVFALGSCKDEIAEEARYTFTGHTIASFLEEHEEVYSSFIDILERGGRLNLMKAYGQYTCFAPTNDAVARFLFEQDSIYWSSVEANKLDKTSKIIWTGVTSPELSELSDSMCKVLSQTHLIPEVYLTTEMEGDIIPVMNMNDRYLSLSSDTDEETGYHVLFINGNGKIIGKDEEVENGVVHTVAEVLNPSANTLPAQIENHTYFSIISEAIERTGYADQLQLYKDDTYTEGDLKASCIYGRTQVPYPANRYFGYTAFLETDSVYNAEGIYNFDDLVAKCKEWYPDADHDAPLTDRKNPVNQFVGYHLLDRKIPYSRLAHYKISFTNYDSEKDFVSTADRNEFFETMSGKLIKITMPRSVPSLQTTILLNYYREQDTDVNMYMNNKVLKADDFRKQDSIYEKFSADALNGTIHPIEKLLIYNEDVMAGRVLNMIIRFDASSLCSELTNNSIRWSYFPNSPSQDGEMYIPHTYCKNMKVYTDETRHYYLPCHTSYANYQGDEMMTLGAFDFAYKLPPVPAGTYEIRMGYTANSLRHVIQFYFDNEVAGIPVDLRIGTADPKIGFVLDSQTEDNGIQNDKEMKNRGYLKGPTTIYGTGTEIGRDRNQTVRVVVTTKYLSEGEHWIRFKNVNENDDGSSQFMHDYFEMVPVNYLRDESVSLEDKRK